LKVIAEVKLADFDRGQTPAGHTQTHPCGFLELVEKEAARRTPHRPMQPDRPIGRRSGSSPVDRDWPGGFAGLLFKIRGGDMPKVFALAVSGLVLLNCIGYSARAATLITPGTPQGDNVELAAKFLRSMGYVEVADDVIEWLQKGYLSVDDIGGADTADTGPISKKIRIDMYNTPINRRIDPKNNLAGIVQLATVLFHEKIHAHQYALMFDANREYEAWTSTIQVLDRWILTQTEKYKLNPTEAEREKLEILLVQKQTELRSFINEHKCFPGWFGYRGWFEEFSDICLRWKTLLSRVNALLREVAQKKQFTKQEEKKVGMLLRRMDSDEQYAIAGGGTSFDQRGIPVGMDLAPPSSVTGFYAGGSVGWRGSSTNWTTTGIDSLGTRDPVGADSDKSMRSGSAYGGLYGGYNWEIASSWFIGGEASFGYGNNTADPGIPGTVPFVVNAISSANDSVTVQQNWDAALRARLGYEINPFTNVFVAGGPAWQRETATLRCSAAGACGLNGIVPFTSANSTTRMGWTVGTGLESQLWRHVVARLEYRHSDYGSYSALFGNSAALAVSSRIHSTSDVALLSVGYSWGR
jgi:outer membrane immunogenic protein